MRRFPMALGLAALAAAGMTARAQEAPGTRLVLGPQSRLALDGTSTLHPFSCNTSEITAVVTVDSSYRTEPLASIARPIGRVDVTIPVRTLKCGHGGLENNMYATLHEKDFPTIRYVLSSYELVAGAVAADSFVARTTGTLTVSGNEKVVEMLVTGRRTPDGLAHATGTIEVNMTDFGIKPPTFFLGTLRVGNKVSITFDLTADRAAVAAIDLDFR